MKLLIKFPTRSRPKKFFEVLDLYYSFADDLDNIQFVITCDYDDPTMNNDQVIQKMQEYINLTFHFGNSKTKIQAVNADVPESDWDILLLASDDMIPKVKGYDNIIRNAMTEHFPDTDGVLNFFDGHRKDLNTLAILGFKYYQRFSYIYYPEYITWFPDEEFMYVSRYLKREYQSDQCIIEHQHPLWMHKRGDKLFMHNNSSVYVSQDRKLFEYRKSIHFDMTKKLSILICTLVEREKYLNRLISILQPQLTDDVEVLTYKDNRQHPIGFKRNALVKKAIGKYVCFIDDDDTICDDYVNLLLEGIEKDVDCCSLIGEITFNGGNPRKFIHSIEYSEYFERDKIYYRPPNHLNCIKKEIAEKFLFPEISMFEDTNWAMQIANAGVLKTEHKIEKTIYFYQWKQKK